MAIKTYKKGTATKLNTNFKSTEFDCHGSGCCSSTLVDEKLVDYVQKIRDHFGKSVTISSGYRCVTHNKNVGGATGSYHAKGQAADIVVSGVTPAEVAKYAESIGILGIGLYETNSDGHFVHVDTRTSKSFWYGQKQAKRTTFGGTTAAINSTTATSNATDLYRVRKSWADAKSQVGAYSVLANAKAACDKAGEGYYVFNSKGESIYPEAKTELVLPTVKALDAKIVWDFYKAKGLNDYGIAGLMGNLYCESGLNPYNLQGTYEKKLGMSDAEYTAAVDAGTYTNFVKDSAGYGLAQWTYWSLKQDMLDYHTKAGKSIGDGETQMAFLAYQLEKDYNTVWKTLKNATSILEASNAVLLKFERPADQSTTAQNTRAAAGQKYYDAYAEKKTTTTTTTVSKGDNGNMKYSDSNAPIVCMQTNSTCYKGTSKMTIKGVLWHSTGANNTSLKRYVQPSDNASDKAEMLKLIGTNSYKNDWNHIERQAGVNAWIGKLADGTIATVQAMPWDYRPWGCGSGSKGSCNSGWIQFEICEDALTDKNYFEAVYKEACELTAYLCKKYNLNPKGTQTINGVTVPVILDHTTSCSLGLGSNHGDVLHWFKKYNKTLDDVRNDVAELMKVTTTTTTSKKEEDTSSNTSVSTEEFKVGDTVKLVAGSTYVTGKTVPTWVINSTLYVREVRKNGDIVFSTQKTGAVTGVSAATNFIKVEGTTTSNSASNTFESYLVMITTSALNVRAGAGTGYKITTQVHQGELYTIVGEKNGWGRLKSGAGWISLQYTKKIK